MMGPYNYGGGKGGSTPNIPTPNFTPPPQFGGGKGGGQGTQPTEPPPPYYPCPASACWP